MTLIAMNAIEELKAAKSHEERCAQRAMRARSAVEVLQDDWQRGVDDPDLGAALRELIDAETEHERAIRRLEEIHIALGARRHDD